MFEIKVTVEIPDLLKAAQMLAGARSKGYVENLEAPKTQIPEAVPPYTAPAAPVFPAPVTTIPAEQQAVFTPATAPAAPAPATPPVVAPTAAPTFTLAQVAKAGADLITVKPALQKELVELLSRFGAKTVKDLPQDRLGEFAAELRALGGKI